MPETDSTFYALLPTNDNFLSAANIDLYHKLPSSWYVVISDVVESTNAVQSGFYKNVNILGAATIISVLNIAKDLEIPFAFEGDGSTLCIPASLLESARRNLSNLKSNALTSFNLDLRIAIIPIIDIEQKGREVLVSKHRVSESYHQASFAGGGVQLAESWIKDPKTQNKYNIESSTGEPNLKGLECRWEDLPSPKGETVCLIVRSANNDNLVYREIINLVETIYGESENCHPVNFANLNLTLSSSNLSSEALINGNASSSYIFSLILFNLVGRFLMFFGIKAGAVNWAKYKQALIKNTDIRKFNDGYRQILAGDTQQRTKLESELSKYHEQGKIYYGLHVSNRALMTCLVFDYSNKHIHFVDGADGGFFMASKQLKQQMSKGI